MLYKQILIILFSFILFFWMQSIDDKKYNVIRKSYYEKFKNPLLLSALIGLILSYIDGITVISVSLSNCNDTKDNFKNPEIPQENDFKFNEIRRKILFNKDEFISFPPPFA